MPVVLEVLTSLRTALATLGGSASALNWRYKENMQVTWQIQTKSLTLQHENNSTSTSCPCTRFSAQMVDRPPSLPLMPLRTALAALGGWLPRWLCALVVMEVGSSRYRDYAYDIWNFQHPSLRKRLWLVSTTPATSFFIGYRIVYNLLGFGSSARSYRLGRAGKRLMAACLPSQVVTSLGVLAVLGS